MKIRPAKLSDLESLYELGLNTSELEVSANEPFMDKDEFKSRIKCPKNLFLLAEEKGKLAGFILASSGDTDSPSRDNAACIVYLAVTQEYRRKGIASKLYQKCENKLKQRGFTYLYCLANAESEAILEFNKKQGFTKGHKLVWMDKRI